uniref:Nucleosome assembly protein 1-like 4a n=1 Tax=Cynoglossus semilaevis TaxID=244447 RepID=A0A3P8VHH9_CYNSE
THLYVLSGKGDQNPGSQADKPAGFHFMESMLPKAVKRRVHALKRLQVQSANIEAKFYEEVHELERKYAALYQPLFDKRRDIVTGTVEPTDAECEWHSDREEEELAVSKGLEHDEPILKHLKDIKVKFSEPGQPMSFSLEFYFEPNGYFNNAVLTKVYKMKSEPEASEPFSFEGPEIIDCEGCQIDWHKGKDVTVKTIKKKQKHKGRGTVRTVTKQVPNDSFFNFFNPVKDAKIWDEDSEFTLATDFEIGHFFRERIVPRAVLYFTGEALEDDESLFELLKLSLLYQEQDDEGDDDDDEGDFDPKVSFVCLY